MVYVRFGPIALVLCIIVVDQSTQIASPLSLSIVSILFPHLLPVSEQPESNPVKNLLKTCYFAKSDSKICRYEVKFDVFRTRLFQDLFTLI